MASPSIPVPLGTLARFRRFTVPQYHRLTEIGVLTENDDVELLEGYLVHKMPRNPPHDGILQRLNKRLQPLLPADWEVRVQMAITLSDSEPEPDLVVVPIDPDDYTKHHPGPSEIGLVIEVANTTLDSDRAEKGRIYSRAGIETYWNVNIVDRQVEVYTDPTGPFANPTYRQRHDHRVGDSVDVAFAGLVLPSISVADLFR